VSRTFVNYHFAKARPPFARIFRCRTKCNDMSYLKKTCLFFLFAFPVLMFAQSENSQSGDSQGKNEVGMDITYLTSSLLGSSGNDFGGSPSLSGVYQLTYRRHFDKFALRLRLGTYLNGEDDENDGNTLTSSSYRVDYRLGLEKTLEISDKWNLFYGIDFRHSISEFNSQWLNGEVLTNRTSSTNRFSLAPILGIEFRIAERISLRTESNMSVFLLREEWKDQEEGNSDLTRDRVTNGFGASVNAPDFLVLSFRF